MRVLFVARKKAGKNNISPFISSQAESLIYAGIKVDIFEASGKGFSAYFKNLLRLRSKIKDSKYDIIHSHYSFQGLQSYFAAPKQIHIISFMGSDLNVLLEKSNSIRNRISKILLAVLFSRINKFKAVIVKSENLFNLVKGRHNNIHIIPNGIDFNKFYPLDQEEAKEKLGLSSKNKIIGFFTASEHDDNKNIALAKKSINIIDNSIPVQFKHVFGVDHHELIYYYNAIDALLFTSKMEGSPNVVKEALACNCPVVSVDVGDVKERLFGVENAYLCEYNSSQIAEAITKLLKNGKRSNGRKMMRPLTNENVANRIIDIYDLAVK